MPAISAVNIDRQKHGAVLPPFQLALLSHPWHCGLSPACAADELAQGELINSAVGHAACRHCREPTRATNADPMSNAKLTGRMRQADTSGLDATSHAPITTTAWRRRVTRALVAAISLTFCTIASPMALAETTPSLCQPTDAHGAVIGQLGGAASQNQAQHASAIAFVTPAGDLGVWSAADGSQRTLVPGPIHAPSWSHDSSRIAYVREGGASGGDRIEVVNTDGTGRTVVLPAQPNPMNQPPTQGISPFVAVVQVRWAPDDSAVYFSEAEGNIVGREICRLDLTSGAVTGGPWGLVFDVGPDGAIVFDDWTNAGLAADEPRYWIGLLPPNNQPCANSLCSLTHPTQKGYSPVWSSDGSEVAFADDQRVWIVDRAGEAGRFVNVGFKVDTVGWAPDGASLAVAGAGEIWRVNAETGEKQQLIDGGGPSWGGTDGAN